MVGLREKEMLDILRPYIHSYGALLAMKGESDRAEIMYREGKERERERERE